MPYTTRQTKKSVIEQYGEMPIIELRPRPADDEYRQILKAIINDAIDRSGPGDSELVDMCIQQLDSLDEAENRGVCRV